MAVPVPPVPEWISDPLVTKLIAAAAVVVAVALLIRVSQIWLGRSLKDADTRYYARKLVALSGYFLAVVGITVIFKDRLGGLTVAIGVAGAGIAFALQEVIGSVAGWIAISFGGFYRPGDRVQVGGIKGDVIDIGILRTTLMELGEWVHSDLYSGRIVRVANSFVFKQPVFNYSGDFPFLWDELTLPVQYGSDHNLVRRILEEIGAEIAAEPFTASVRSAWRRMVKKYLIENAGVEPQITLVLTDNWMEFTLRYVVDVKARRSTKDHLYTRILEEFDRAGDRARIASATVQLVQP
ncbi:MAG: mechanosensitive ion channel family protein, partial [Cyanobium sp. Prado107]|nr:mechanosensitive ion channel family protein [Cyanobium sp. Prado107]